MKILGTIVSIGGVCALLLGLVIMMTSYPHLSSPTLSFLISAAIMVCGAGMALAGQKVKEL